jgi:hypothetical protein
MTEPTQGLIKELKFQAPRLADLANRLFKEGFNVLVAEGRDGKVSLIVSEGKTN